MTRQGWARRGRAWRGLARLGVAWIRNNKDFYLSFFDKARQGLARHGKAWQGEARRGRARLG